VEKAGSRRFGAVVILVADLSSHGLLSCQPTPHTYGHHMNIWLIADTHWGHERLQVLAERPADFGEQIIKNWRATVGMDDLVIHLGDVIWKRDSELKGVLESLPGWKVLVRGNHDHQRTRWYMTRGFSFVCEMFVRKGVLFTHVPFFPVLRDRFTANVHGHLHGGAEIRHTDEMDGVYDPSWHKLVALEHHYSPIRLEDVT